jgi:uncharacterized protein (DUF433 family)
VNLTAATVATPFRADDNGAVRIGKSRVMLERIVHAFDTGASAEEIVESYPSLELADVYATIAFILQHRPEVDTYMADQKADADRVYQMWELRKPSSDLRQRIRARARGL